MLIDVLVGKKVKRVFMNALNLRFETDQGDFVFGVEGDCCSQSYFHDFYGVKNLLEHGAVTEVKEVPVDSRSESDDGESVQAYGYQMTTESGKFGPVTSVFSFRNYSNGYYGGFLTREDEEIRVSPELTDDVVEIATP